MSSAKPCGEERWDQKGPKQYLRRLDFNPTLKLRKFKVPRHELAARDVAEGLPTSTLMERLLLLWRREYGFMSSQLPIWRQPAELSCKIVCSG